MLEDAVDDQSGAASFYEALTGKSYEGSTLDERYAAFEDEAVLQQTYGSRDAFTEATGKDWDTASSEDRLTAAFEYVDQAVADGAAGGDDPGAEAFGSGAAGSGTGTVGGGRGTTAAGGSSGDGTGSGGDHGDQGDGDGVGGFGSGTTGGGAARAGYTGSDSGGDISEAGYDDDGNRVVHVYTRTEQG